MLAIGRDETAESLAEFRSKHQYEFPMYADSDGSVFSSYAESLIPRTYLIARDGTICFACTGFREDRFDELKSILGEQLREPKTGR
jgi:peroxiredoxin